MSENSEKWPTEQAVMHKLHMIENDSANEKITEQENESQIDMTI